jgi:hypothetical protein
VLPALYLCGGRFTLSGHVPETLWSDDVRPFTEPVDFTFSHEIQLNETDDLEQLEITANTFVYRRHDLIFIAGQERSVLWYDGGLAAVLAGLELALSQTIRALGGALLHASAGVISRRCWVMPGPSGAGKSTAARGGFDEVLSDERVALLPSGDGYQVWSTPFWSDGRDVPLSTGSARLCVLAFLNKAEIASLATIGRAKMVAWLLRSLVLYETSVDAQTSTFDLACRIVDSAQCVTLDFPKEGVWVPSVTKPIGLAS